MESIGQYTTAARKRYRARCRKPDTSQTDKRGFRTKRDAELFLASVEISKSQGDYVDTSAARITVHELGTAWLKSQTNHKPSSRDAINLAWRLFVKPMWGDRAVGDINYSSVQTWASQLGSGEAKTAHGAGPRSPTVFIRACDVLAAILGAALGYHRISSNPARGASLPRKVKKPHVSLTHNQVSLLAEHARDTSTLLLTLVSTGLRWGEAVGPRVRDLNPFRHRVNVRENAVRVGGRILVGTPKTHAARSVPFPELLTVHLAKAAEG